MKKSIVAMALIMVLCMAQCLIGNAAGKAQDITIAVNDGDAANGAITSENVEGGVKFTGTASKGEWSCLKGTIEGNAKEFAKLVLEVEGKAGTVLKLKLEGGTDAAVVETSWPQANLADPVLVDGVQTIEWTLDPTWLTSNGGQSLIIFINPGVAGATEPVIIKSVKLCTADYADEQPTEAPTEAPTQAPSNTNDGGKFPVVPVVAAVVVVAVLAVVLAKKKKAA